MASLSDTIEALLWEDESTTLDFKQAQYPFATATDGQKSEIIKDILAFANAFRRDDAYILLGVRDQQGGRAIIIGVTNHLDDASLQQLVNTKTNRAVTFSYHAIDIDSKQVGVIRIPRQQRPFYLLKNYGKLHANDVYLRHGSSTSIATHEEVARMGADDHPRTTNPEAGALNTLLLQARFYTRILQLVQDISNLPDHYITQIPRGPAYEEKRRALHARFNDDHHAFSRAMSSARDLLTAQQPRVPPNDAGAITAILAATLAVERSVTTLAQWANDRLDPIEPRTIPWDRQHDAEQAAEQLSALVSQRLLAIT